MKTKNLFLMIGLLMLSIIQTLQAQEKNILSQTNFSPEEMKKMLAKFSSDPAWSALMKDVAGKKFKQLEKSSWGFSGEVIDAAGKKQEVLFCAFDFYNPNSKTGQGCSMIWRKVGSETYKAYLIFPEGEKNTEKALANSQEWFANDKGEIQKAHSWGKCFLKCVQTSGQAPGLDVDIKKGRVKIGGSTFKINCATQCFTGAIACSGVAAGVAVSGVGVPFAIGILATCVGVTCGSCVSLCALGCI